MAGGQQEGLVSQSLPIREVTGGGLGADGGSGRAVARGCGPRLGRHTGTSRPHASRAADNPPSMGQASGRHPRAPTCACTALPPAVPAARQGQPLSVFRCGRAAPEGGMPLRCAGGAVRSLGLLGPEALALTPPAGLGVRWPACPRGCPRPHEGVRPSGRCEWRGWIRAPGGPLGMPRYGLGLGL